jgi:hypothetical protein
LGALLDGLVSGLKNLATVHITDKPRMADFALWAEACTRAYWPTGTFLQAYRSNLAGSVELVLEANPVGEAIRLFMADKTEWSGTASVLLPLLTTLVGEQAAKDQGWPKRANVLSGKLRRAAPSLRKVGIHIVFERGATQRHGLSGLRRGPSPSKRVNHRLHRLHCLQQSGNPAKPTVWAQTMPTIRDDTQAVRRRCQRRRYPLEK